MSKEGYLSKRRLCNAMIGAVAGFVIVFIIFTGLQLVGILASGSVVEFVYSLWAALLVGVISFFSIVFLTPRYLGPTSEVAVGEKVDSRIETMVEAMEGEGHFHVKGERKEEDVLKRLEESHEPQGNRKSGNQD